ncbi:hypothetical protein B0T18DRAFT_447246 [Schizothecium vesticola]|uniref:Cyanovirin-N domain-containing protein n=1 Tax=Schizothecium vesticola TaxID=314040 RepID=A0AA40EWT0_9PEZI|nr:hypothetical protein B0T18DRAFT_447246 [Schizothecium vesticola]
MHLPNLALCLLLGGITAAAPAADPTDAILADQDIASTTAPADALARRSFQNSCGSCFMTGWTLTCTCPTITGSGRRSSLNLGQSCVANHGGTMAAQAGGNAQNSCQPPEFQWHNQVRIGAWCVAGSVPGGQRLTHSWLSLEGLVRNQDGYLRCF